MKDGWFGKLLGEGRFSQKEAVTATAEQKIAKNESLEDRREKLSRKLIKQERVIEKTARDSAVALRRKYSHHDAAFAIALSSILAGSTYGMYRLGKEAHELFRPSQPLYSFSDRPLLSTDEGKKIAEKKSMQMLVGFFDQSGTAMNHLALGMAGKFDITRFNAPSVETMSGADRQETDTARALNLADTAHLGYIVVRLVDPLKESLANKTDDSIVATEKVLDKYGNELNIVKKIKGANILTDVTVLDPISQPESNRDVSDFSLDLTTVGGPDIPNFAEQTPPVVLRQAGNNLQYTFEANRSEIKKIHVSDEDTAIIANTIANVEGDFNLAVGSHIKRIMVADSVFPEGSAPGGNFDFISISQKVLSSAGESKKDAEIREQELRVLVRHECLHSMDFKFSLSKELEPNFAAIPKKFFSDINEEKFLKEQTPFGGHSADNIRELWATFMDDALDASWENKIVRLSPENRQIYLSLLGDIQNALESRDELAKSKVLETVRERIVFLKKSPS